MHKVREQYNKPAKVTFCSGEGRYAGTQGLIYLAGPCAHTPEAILAMNSTDPMITCMFFALVELSRSLVGIQK